MNTSPLSIIPTASWSVGTTNYQPDFIAAAVPDTAMTAFTTEAAPKVGGVGGRALPSVFSALALSACTTAETQHADGNSAKITQTEWKNMEVFVGGMGLALLFLIATHDLRHGRH